MRIGNLIQAAFAAVASFLVSLPQAYLALIAAMGADILIGVLRAAARRELVSDIAFVGMLKKSAMLIVVALSALMGRFLQVGIPGVSLPLGEAVAIFFAISEALSVLENAAALGLPVPGFLRAALEARSPEKFPEKFDDGGPHEAPG